MKVRNLLLAGLAVAAMTACSNNEIDEIVDNGNPVAGEQANMRISFAFDNADKATSRASSVKENGTSAGETFEWKAATITVVLDYSLGNQPKMIVKPGLTLIEEPNSGNQNVATYATGDFTVDQGYNVKVYAFINPTEAFNKQLQAAASAGKTDLSTLTIGAQTLPVGNLDYLTGENQVANSGNFFMSGSAVKDQIVPETANKIDIKVSRVTAKLEELTSDDLFTLDASKLSNPKDIKIQLTKHSYSNLSSDSYALLNDNKSFKNDFLQPYVAQGGVATSKTYTWIDKSITYCLENYGNGTPTRVHYQAQVYFNDQKIENDFYVRASNISGTKVLTAYPSWEALQTAYGNQFDDSKKQDDTYLKNVGLKRYKAGTCYYEAEILHAGQGSSIYRNNWYQLTVSKISDLGYPEPVVDPNENATTLTVNAKIQPWTIQVNNVEL